MNNSWLALDFALVDADERVVSQFGNEASYYHGQDSEGSWSEGSRSFSSYFKVNKAGAYRLLLHGQGGSGEKDRSRNEPVDVAAIYGYGGSLVLYHPHYRVRPRHDYRAYSPNEF